MEVADLQTAINQRQKLIEDILTRMEHVELMATEDVQILKQDQALIKAALANAETKANSGDHQMKFRDARDYIPDKWSGEEGAREFMDFSYDIMNYLYVLAPHLKIDAIMPWVAKTSLELTDEVIAQEEERDVNLKGAKDISRALGQVLTKCTTGTAKYRDMFSVIL